MRSAPTPLFALALVAAVACDDPAATLIVEVRSDLVPGVEFVGARTRIERPDGTRLGGSDRIASAGDDFLGGVRLEELAGLAPGIVHVRVGLLDAAGAPVVERLVIATVTQSRAVTVLLTRNCRGIECPAPDGDPTATACLDGRCVDPSCTVETPEACGPSTCAADAECGGTLVCAGGVCAAGVCLLVPEDDRCGPGERCDLDTGCVSVGPTDAGSAPDGGVAPDAGIDGGFDAGPDAGVDAGFDGGVDAGSDAGPACLTAGLVGGGLVLGGSDTFCPPPGSLPLNTACVTDAATIDATGDLVFDVPASGAIVIGGGGLVPSGAGPLRITLQYAGTRLIYLRLDEVPRPVTVTIAAPMADVFIHALGGGTVTLGDVEALDVSCTAPFSIGGTLRVSSINASVPYQDPPPCP